ncbi:sodium-dependent serotonin transporter-like [Cydia strobilella]|uniref:sodium-dependent serotonin transporter-like n=1 Tax=Cydia strobilella TaxID=1100964 RepID=UPI003004A014
MSDSGSSATKTATESVDSESTDVPLVADRWTNNINYRQLVVSSCVGILQLWWHPYLFDLRKLLPFIFLYNVFSLVIGYPMFYLELGIGVVTKKGIMSSWDLSPIARGVGCSMLLTCAATALAIGAVSAWCLAQLVHSAHSFLPWLHCAAAALPACAARHRSLTAGSETPAHSFFFNFVLKLRRDGLKCGLGNIVWELTIYYIICWILIYLIAVKRVYSYSKLVLFKDTLAFFVLICSAIGCLNLEGAGNMFHYCDWGVLFEGTQIWREAIEYSLIEMTVGQGTLVMLGSYCPQQQHKLSTTVLLTFLAAKVGCMTSALVLGATHGALMKDYEVNSTHLWSGPSTPMILWADFAARIPGSQFWSAVIFFTLFVLSLSFVALLVQTIMSAFTGHSIRKITWALLIAICILFCFIGVMTLCTQGGLYVVTFLMDWPVTRTRTAIAGIVAASVSYAYGQTVFCEDMFFAVGEYPCVFVRVCWAVAPFILMVAFLSGLVEQAQYAAAGWSLVTFMLAPIAFVSIIYLIFKFRVRNIVSEK